MDTGHEALVSWIDALRGRIVTGQLGGFGPVAVRSGILSADQAARIMLVDLAHASDGTVRARLLRDLRRLRDQIG